MSLDKEPADVAMEFLAEELPSSLPQGDPTPPPILKTAQDLLDWVSSDPELTPQQRAATSARRSWRARER